MELEEEISEWPVSPSGQYLNSSVLSLTILAVLETEIPIDDSPTTTLLKDVFLPINPRFSSIMVGEKNGVKKWKKVEVNLKDHVNVPKFPNEMSPEYYDKCFNEYLSNLAMDPLPQTRPLWEIHIFKYPTSNSAGSVIFKLHHALGDGYSLIGALLSCLQRVDDPSLPLTFPSRQSNATKAQNDVKSIFKLVPQVSSWVANTVWDFGWSLLKSSVLKDDESPIRSGHDDVEFRPLATTTLAFSLDHIKQIQTNLKVTINDVISGVILLGTRLYMEGESNNSSEANSTALVLLNTRNIGGYESISEMVKPKAKMPWGNHFAFLHVTIPKIAGPDSFDPLNFVFETQKIIKRKRNNAAVFLTGGLLEKLRHFKGPEATAKYIHSTMKNTSMAITNLIGPVEKMSLANHPIRGLYFCVAGAPQSVSVTLVSYMRNLRITIVVEKDFIDPLKFKKCIKNAFDMIFEAAVVP